MVALEPGCFVMIQRGRRLFLILASIIVINEFINILLVIIGGTSISGRISSLLFPAFILWGVWEVWRTGERVSRMGLGCLLILRSAFNLCIFGYLMIGMAKVTPPEKAAFFWEISALLFALPGLHAIVFIAIGLAICFSRSIRMFLETRTESFLRKFVDAAQ